MKIDFMTHATMLIHAADQAVIFGKLISDEPLDEGNLGHSQVYKFKGKQFCIEGYTNTNKITIEEV